QGVFSIFFYTKKMLVKFTNIKKYRAFRGCDIFLSQPLFYLKNISFSKNKQGASKFFLYALHLE
ncbi:hypothetical protein MKL22_12675, partial [Enterococcus faecium]|uniref:hypothetical protein n=1 Tax=Enterococcus faecium TaxID=1352 RepID=UPI001F05965C